MKYLSFKGICLLAVVCQAGTAHAQFLGGFFSQQSSKEKLMAEQILGLELYLHNLKSGYHIRDNGLTSAHGLKGDTFGLHTGYFQSLLQVNPVVRNDPKGRSIAALQQEIVNEFSQEISWQQKQDLLQANEKAYLKQVYENLLIQTQNDMSELIDILTPGKLQLTDQQRLERVDHIYESMRDKYAFAGYFTVKCRKLALSRQQSSKDKNQLRKLYGIQ